MVSLIAWGTVGMLAIYPHFIFREMINKKKQETLDVVDKKINQQYELIMKNKKAKIELDQLFALKSHILESKTSPITVSGFIGVTIALILNLIPTVIEIFL